MIDPEALARWPVRERDLLPVASDEQVVQDFQESIEYIRKHVKSPLRAPHPRHTTSLFHMSGEEEYSLVYTRSRFGQRRDKLRVDRGRGQELLFKVMGAYGFDSNTQRPRLKYNYDNRRHEEDVAVRPDGTTREVTLYPSQTIKGLVFERARSFVTETGEVTDVRWNVVDEGPLLKFYPRIVFGRKPQISL